MLFQQVLEKYYTKIFCGNKPFTSKKTLTNFLVNLYLVSKEMTQVVLDKDCNLHKHDDSFSSHLIQENLFLISKFYTFV